MDCGNCRSCEQPPLWEHTMTDGVFIKQMYLKDAGTLVPQHSHAYDHTSMLARGRIRMWKDGEEIGDFSAPQPLFIEAKSKHAFMSLEPETLIYCIHNVSRRGFVQIHEEHQISSRAV
jgi:quercetin dioxygenase-like cupin family protein